MCFLETNELHRIFEKLDRDGDGHVSLDELSWFLDKIGVNTELDELEAIVGCKSLDLEEFIFFYESICKNRKGDSIEGEEENGDEERDLIEAFKVFDLNDDGFISCDELQSVLMRLGLWEETSGGDCKRMILEFDTNSDGVLDFKEFKNMMLLTIC